MRQERHRQHRHRDRRPHRVTDARRARPGHGEDERREGGGTGARAARPRRARSTTAGPIRSTYAAILAFFTRRASLADLLRRQHLLVDHAGQELLRRAGPEALDDLPHGAGRDALRRHRRLVDEDLAVEMVGQIAARFEAAQQRPHAGVLQRESSPVSADRTCSAVADPRAQTRSRIACCRSVSGRLSPLRLSRYDL